MENNLCNYTFIVDTYDNKELNSTLKIVYFLICTT